MPGRKSHTLIPPKAQIPVMIGGLILLVAILVWRLSSLRNSDNGSVTVQTAAPAPANLGTAAPAQPTPAVVTTPALASLPADPAGQLTELQSLLVTLGKVRRGLGEDAGKEGPLVGEDVSRPLPRNPFASLRNAAPNKEATSGGETTAAEPREKRLSDLRLRGTLMSGNTALADFNGKTFRQGDHVRGFTIQKIDPTRVTISDQQGTVVFRMEGAPEP